MSYALDGIDIRMRKYLNYDNGFFIECGANDGVTQSNTCLYEQQFGWTGLLVEPCPINFNKCKQSRPNSIVENFALVRDSYEQNKISGYFDPHCYNGLMSPILDTPEYFDEEQKSSKADFIEKFHLVPVEVSCCTLQSLLDKHSIQQVDFFSLDVEGYELEVLEGFNFNKVKPTYILIETTTTESRRDMMKDYMDKHSYDFVEQLTGNDALFQYSEDNR